MNRDAQSRMVGRELGGQPVDPVAVLEGAVFTGIGEITGDLLFPNDDLASTATGELPSSGLSAGAAAATGIARWVEELHRYLPV